MTFGIATLQNYLIRGIITVGTVRLKYNFVKNLSGILKRSKRLKLINRSI